MAGKPIRIAILANGRQARAELERTGLASTKLGKTVGKVAKGMGLAFAGIEAAHLAGDLVKQASEFQKSITLLSTAGGEAKSALAGISHGILKISDATGTSANDLAEGMYLLEKAGIRGADGLKVLQNAAQGAAAENVDMATETQAVTSIMTSYHVAAGKSASVVNELVAASGAAKTTMQEFAGSLSSVLPAASAAGLKFDEVGGAIATLTQHGTSADRATDELANTIRNLQAPNNVASKEMQQLGLSVTNVSKNLGKRGLTGTLALVEDAIKKHIGKSGLVGLDAFKKWQSGTADLQIMLKKMPPDLAQLSQGFLDGSVTAKDYRKAFKDMGAQGNAMGSQFLSLATRTGGFNDLLAAGNPAAQTYADALKKVMGGAVGMNTALQLSGENMAGFRARVEEVNKAAQDTKGVSTWKQTADTFDVQIKRVKNSLQNLGISLVLPALPGLSRGFAGLADTVSNAEPAVERMLRMLKPGAEVVKLLAEGINAIPGPLKSLAVEAGIAAVIFPRLASGVTRVGTSLNTGVLRLKQYAAELTYVRTESALNAAAMTRLRGSMTNLAGVGGMVALTAGASTGSKALTGLGGALTGAALGAEAGSAVFPVYGTAVGAAIGGIAGLALSTRGLSRDTDSATSAAKINQATLRKITAQKVAASSYDDLRATLDQATGAYTKNTRAAIENWLQTDKTGKKVRDALAARGVGDRTVIASLLGNPEANARVTSAFNSSLSSVSKKIAALQKKITDAHNGTGPGLGPGQVSAIQGQIDALTAQKRALVANQGALTGESNALRKASKDQRDFYASTAPIARQLKLTKKAYDATFSKKVRGELELDGVPSTLAGIKKVARATGGLTRREWKILLKASGVTATEKQLTALVKTGQKVATDVGKQGKDSSNTWIKQYKAGLTQGQGPVKTSMTGLLTTAATQAKAIAKRGGNDLGHNVALGVGAGIRAGGPYVNNQMIAMINQAIAAAKSKKGADTHSPSRKTIPIGGNIAEGLIVGLRTRSKSLENEGAASATAVLRGMQRRPSAVDVYTRQRQRQSAQGDMLTAALKHQVQVAFPDRISIDVGDGRFPAYVRGHARAVARDEIDQDNAFWRYQG